MPASTGAQGDYPQLNPYASSNDVSPKVRDAGSKVKNSAQQAYDTVANHPVTQNVKDTIAQQPLAQSASNQAAKTSGELNALADTRRTPSQPAATGQNLTNYHSFFYSLFSWENPRATAVAFVLTATFILASRYLNLFKYVLKATYLVLGVTATAEIVGKVAFGSGFASSMRPKRYYTIPREALEATLEDVEQLINFFVIEFQRILFAENVFATLTVAASALVAVGLMKITPMWGLALLATTFMYLTPLIYIKNKEVIDSQISHASDVMNQQAASVRDLAAQHTGKATETVSAYTKQYTAQAQQYLGGNKANGASKASDFPKAPSHEPAVGKTSGAQPVAAH